MQQNFYTAPNKQAVRLEASQTYDVLVLGSGIAGISAAIAASEAGRRTALVCKGRLFSGSSFYPGTWGLGLIGPESRSDEEDLIETIKTVGCGMAREGLVWAFVSGIRPAISRVEEMGLKLRKAQSGADQREYIPCFDHKHRAWNGIEFSGAAETFSEKLKQGQVTVYPGWEALELKKQGGRVCGAIMSDGNRLQFLSAKTVVLATGGYGSLFSRHLCTSDVEGLGQSLALDAGCRLINMEFMQIMPAYLRPAYGTVFNEKVFRYAILGTENGPLLADRKELLALRSGHGPFSARLASREVDLAICSHPEGVTVRYDPSLRQDPPEFVKTYFDWLEKDKGLTMEDPVEIGLFAHAANGGVCIGPQAFTGVPGLFAAGEVTGGMHGADRIGGLSTANGLVFGTKAGFSAAADAETAPEPPSSADISQEGISDCPLYFSRLQKLMTENAMAIRREDGLQIALEEVTALLRLPLQPLDSVQDFTASRRLRGQLQTAAAILTAQKMRRESRGSHYRSDYPQEDPALSRPILLTQSEKGLCAALESAIPRPSDR